MRDYLVSFQRRNASLAAPGGLAIVSGRPAIYLLGMCRNIRPLFNFEPPATDDEIQAAALQYVRKVSGTRTPTGNNQMKFQRAVEEIAAITKTLVYTLETRAEPKNRDIEAEKARERSARRFG
jgi:hypothetical protein